jgi:hypothetical protein
MLHSGNQSTYDALVRICEKHIVPQSIRDIILTESLKMIKPYEEHRMIPRTRTWETIDVPKAIIKAYPEFNVLISYKFYKKDMIPIKPYLNSYPAFVKDEFWI